MGVRVTYEQKVSVPCPKCGARKHRECRPVSHNWGYPLANLHRDRRQAWLDYALKDASESA